MGKTGHHAKIGLIILLVLLFASCNAIKRVPEGKQLLVENQILVDSLEPKDLRVANLPVQQPNQRLLNIPLRLHIYNLARPHRDSIFLNWMQDHPKQLKRRNKLLSEKQTIRLGEGLVKFNRWLKQTGEAPSIIDRSSIAKSEERLRAWYWSQGYFNTEVASEVVAAKGEQKILLMMP